MRVDTDSESDDLTETHEINVTPFIDVILVLLIIFMVAAPLATVDVAVDLPAASATPLPKPDKPVIVTLHQDLTLAIAERSIERATLAAELDGATASDHDARIFLRADKGVSYGDLMATLDDLRAAGYLKVALVSLERVK